MNINSIPRHYTQNIDIKSAYNDFYSNEMNDYPISSCNEIPIITKREPINIKLKYSSTSMIATEDCPGEVKRYAELQFWQNQQLKYSIPIMPSFAFINKRHLYYGTISCIINEDQPQQKQFIDSFKFGWDYVVKWDAYDTLNFYQYDPNKKQMVMAHKNNCFVTCHDITPIILEYTNHVLIPYLVW